MIIQGWSSTWTKPSCAAQLQAFLTATQEISFTGAPGGADQQRYEHIKAPRSNGRAGWVRIDSVHQGDLDGLKGVYHITCVDAVSQWQVQACVQGISEAFLLPVLEVVIAQFPFQVDGFQPKSGYSYPVIAS